MKRILLAVLLLAVLLYGCAEREPAYITVGEETYPADISRLDLRDRAMTAAEYEQLRAALPECEILWRVPFQGQYLEPDVRELSLASLTLEELETLAYFPDLENIQIRSFPGSAVLEALSAAVPECTVRYFVPIGGRNHSVYARHLTLSWEALSRDGELLAWLPELTDVTLSDTVTDLDAMASLMEEYPDVRFHFTFSLFDRELSNAAAEVDLSGIAMESVEAVEAALPLFHGLERLILCDTGLPSEELDALWKRHPEIRVIWNVKIGYSWLRTDTTTFMPFKLGFDGLEGIEMTDRYMTELKYLVDVVCMDLGHQGMTNIEFVRNMPNLKYLIIADSPVKDLSPLEGLKNLEYLEAFMNHITDISPLAGCTGLRDVNLCYNDITDISPLLELPHLENIWLSSNWGVPDEQRQQVKDTFPDAKIVFMTRSSTGEGWRELPRYYEQRALLGMGIMYG